MGSNRLQDTSVQVLIYGAWVDGWLDPDDDWRRTVTAGSPPVRYQPEPHSNAMDAFDQDLIRKV